jgi:6-phosphofructokinase 1
MGYEAVKVLAEGAGNSVIGIQNGCLADMDMEEALATTKTFQMDRYQILEALTNSCGPDF